MLRFEKEFNGIRLEPLERFLKIIIVLFIGLVLLFTLLSTNNYKSNIIKIELTCEQICKSNELLYQTVSYESYTKVCYCISINGKIQTFVM